MNKTISWILVITLLLCTLCACTAPAEEGSGTEAETPTNAPSEAAPSGVESGEPETTDAGSTEPETTDAEVSEQEPTDTESAEAEPTDTESTVPPLPELPSDRKEVEMLYRRAHGLEDDAAFEEYRRVGRVGKTPLPSLISADHLSVGMTVKQVFDMIPGYAMIWEVSDYRRYESRQPVTGVFFVDKDQRYVVLEFDTEERIEKITVYDEVAETVPTREEIDAIPEGATIYEVIDVLGFPRYSTMNGNRRYCFTDNKLFNYVFTDVYDNNLRLYSSQLDWISDEGWIWVDYPDWFVSPEASTEEPTEEEPSETFDPEEPTLMLETLAEEPVT